MKTYQRHLQSTLAVGETVDRTRKPVFRSSAIFPVLQDGALTTRILFMGYWLLKRHITEVQLLVTLRGADGSILLRSSLLVDRPKAYALHLGELLARAALPTDAAFTGSVELEIYSTRDLVFPYPAFVLNYLSDDCVTTVHTAGRVYNDIDDLIENDEYQVPESGFDVLSDPDARPFVAYVNGPYAAERQRFGWTLVDAEQTEHTGTIEIRDVRPYQPVVLRLDEQLDLKGLLKGGKGCLKLRHSLRGIFPRLLCGNFRLSRPAVSITHSYYDSSSVADASAYWARTSDAMHDSSIFVPVFTAHNAYTDLVFYPIYSPSGFRIDLTFHASDGAVLGRLPDWMHVTEQAHPFKTVRLNDLIAAAVPAASRAGVTGMQMVKNWERRDRIPTRLKFGLNVGQSGQALDLPTNICFNSELGNANVVGKKGTFKWCPVLNHTRSIVAITNPSGLREYDRSAVVRMGFYREDDDASVERTVTLPPFGQHRVELPEDRELTEFLGGRPGWVTITSDNPFVRAWYFDFSDVGVVGGDHSF